MTDQAGNSLRDNWVTALQVAFKSSFKDVGKCSCTCVSGPLSSQPNTHFLKTRRIKLCSVSMIQVEQNRVTSCCICFVGKGWYNLNESNYETYCFSKLRRLLTLTRYMMEDTLRSLILDNHLKFLTFVQGVCSNKVWLQDNLVFQSDIAASAPASHAVNTLMLLEQAEREVA